jgi:hypothetical protein
MLHPKSRQTFPSPNSAIVRQRLRGAPMYTDTRWWQSRSPTLTDHASLLDDGPLCAASALNSIIGCLTPLHSPFPRGPYGCGGLKAAYFFLKLRGRCTPSARSSLLMMLGLGMARPAS